MSVCFHGQKLCMSRARKPKAKPTQSDYVSGATKVFVGAIPSKVTLAEFRDYFSRFGPIEDAFLPLKSKSHGTNRGHGFVTYVHASSAKLVVEKAKEHCLRAKWVN